VTIVGLIADRYRASSPANSIDTNAFSVERVVTPAMAL